MKPNTQKTVLIIFGLSMCSSVIADDTMMESKPDLSLQSVDFKAGNPWSAFHWGNSVVSEADAKQTEARIRAASINAHHVIESLKARTNQTIAHANAELAATNDPIARAVLRTQLGSLDKIATALSNDARQLRNVDTVHIHKLAGRPYWSVWMAGTQHDAYWQGYMENQVDNFNSTIATTEARVNGELTGMSDESTEAQIRAAKATLTKGSVATGGVLAAPGGAVGDEQYVVTNGVTNRTITGQHGDLLMHGIGSGEATLRETPDPGETKRNASLLMLGEHQEAKISAGESAILIGDNSKTEGNGIAIGKNATSGNDSIALGNNSVATGANELSIGNDDGLNRKITHMADGTNDSDGATIHNVKSEISRLDSKAQGYATAAKSEAVKDANQYSDDTAKKTLKSANDYTERRAVVAENNAVTRSNAYTDESSSRTLESANTYTNHRSVQAENNAVARSNAYTDNRFGELKHQVDRNEKRANGGIAGAMAMTAIPSVPGHDFSFGMATSGYRGQGAIAAGVKANITQNTTVSLNTAWDSGNGVGVAAGFSVGW
ncbi:YadA-like family protein [Salmonella enterica]|nr:YadA-like family protein [Salmonella enterica]